MTSPRFHCPVPLAAGTSIELPENAARHAARVLRLRVDTSDRLHCSTQILAAQSLRFTPREMREHGA